MNHYRIGVVAERVSRLSSANLLIHKRLTADIDNGRGSRGHAGARPLFRLAVTTLIVFNIGIAQLAAHPGRIAVTNEGDGTLTVVDEKSPNKGRVLKLGGDPHNLAATDNGLLVITHPAAGYVDLVDAIRLERVHRWRISGRPHSVAIDGDRALVAAEFSARLHLIDLETREATDGMTLDAAPHNLAVDGGGQAWITSPAASRLLRVEPERKAVSGTVTSMGRVHDLAVEKRSGTVWVVSWGLASVYRLSGGPEGELQRFDISGRRSHHVAVSPSGEEVWITNNGSDDVSVVDVTSGGERRVAVGDAPHHVTFSGDGHRAYVANSGSNDLSVIDVATKSELRRIPVGRDPHGVAAFP